MCVVMLSAPFALLQFYGSVMGWAEAALAFGRSRSGRTLWLLLLPGASMLAWAADWFH